MKLLSRDFTALEKIVLLILILVLMGIGYYRFIDQPVRQGIEEAHIQRDNLQVELNAVNARIDEYRRHVEEINEAKELRQIMPSYNSSEEELRILNDILGAADSYAFNMEKIELSGNQIRRNFTFSFSASNFERVRGIFARLSNSRVRCLVGDVDCGGLTVLPDRQEINVRADGTFYETRVDAEVDAVLGELLAAA